MRRRRDGQRHGQETRKLGFGTEAETPIAPALRETANGHGQDTKVLPYGMRGWLQGEARGRRHESWVSQPRPKRQ